MKEFELKYGCNPNQKPSKIYMSDGCECPSSGTMSKTLKIHMVTIARRSTSSHSEQRS